MSLSIFLVAFSSGDRIPDLTLHVGLVVIRGSQIELIVDYALLPFAICVTLVRSGAKIG
jgi:hypothetical protein